jgi:hypothetical protein
LATIRDPLLRRNDLQFVPQQRPEVGAVLNAVAVEGVVIGHREPVALLHRAHELRHAALGPLCSARRPEDHGSRSVTPDAVEGAEIGERRPRLGQWPLPTDEARQQRGVTGEEVEEPRIGTRRHAVAAVERQFLAHHPLQRDGGVGVGGEQQTELQVAPLRPQNVDRLPRHGCAPNRVDADLRAPTGEGAHPLAHIAVAQEQPMGRAEGARQRQLLRVEVDRGHFGTVGGGDGDRRKPDPPSAEHHHALPGLDPHQIDQAVKGGHETASERGRLPK